MKYLLLVLTLMFLLGAGIGVAVVKSKGGSIDTWGGHDTAKVNLVEAEPPKLSVVDDNVPQLCNEAMGLPKCPEPEVTYKPNFPPLGEYSVTGACEAIHDDTAPKVTLRDREPLQDALARLKEKAGYEGGIIEIPWDVETIQCDRIRNVRNHAVRTLTLRGVLGPNGEQPRFYCRGAALGGTVTKGWAGTFSAAGAGGKYTTGEHLVENLHIDGYGTWFMSPRNGKAIYRNNYAHHAQNNGNSINGVHPDEEDETRLTGADLEYCGNEFSHGGQGNAKHTFYLHRGQANSLYRVWLVDNVIHSTNYSSGFKSIANENYIYGNRFYKTVPPADYQPSDPKYKLTTDPSYPRRYSQMPLDVIACSKNIIDGNYFYNWRPKPKGHASGWMLAIRNRKDLFGCDTPRGYKGKMTQPEKVPESLFWKQEYWDSIAGTYPLKTIVRNNIFENTGPDAKATAIVTWGTYPNNASRQFGPACLLEAPEGWFERHRLYVENNTYIGFGEGTRGTQYVTKNPGHLKNLERCGLLPSTENLREPNMIIIGQGEVIKK